jgi:hypothetical protein
MGASGASAGPGYPLVSFAWEAKGYRSYPLRGRKPKAFAFPKTASLPFLSGKFFAMQKTYKTITTGLPAGPFEGPV